MSRPVGHVAAGWAAAVLTGVVLFAVPLRAQTQPPAERAITLEELRQIALQYNPTLAQAAAEIRAAEGRRLQSGLYPNPVVGYSGEEIAGGPSRGGEQGFFVEQQIVLGGKLGLNRRIFEQERLQAEAEAEEQMLRVMGNLRIAWLRVLAAQQTLELRRSLNRLAADAMQTSVQLANVGQADAPDVLEAEVEAHHSELEVVRAEQGLRRAWRELAAVIGRPDLPLATVAGSLEEIPEVNVDEWLERLVTVSPAVRIAELGVARAEAMLARARREPVPDLRLRGGLQQNRELREATGQAVGLQGFAEVGVELPIFNRNQGAVEASRAEVERAGREVERVRLLLASRASAVVEEYRTAREAVRRYRDEILPRARRAYQMYAGRYQAMAAAYPQVLIAQRTLMQAEVAYVAALESAATSGVALESYLLTDGLDAPARPGDIDRPVREVNMPSQMRRGMGE